MSYLRTESFGIGMGTNGGSSGGSSGGGVSAGDTASSVVGAVTSIVGSILGSYYEIQGMRQQRQALGTGTNLATAQLLEEQRYSREARMMAAEEEAAQLAAVSSASRMARTQEQEIARQAALLRQSQAQREISERIGGRYGESRTLPSWAWWGIGAGVIGATFLTIWLVSRRG